MKRKKKLLIVLAALVLLGLGLPATWLICDWPPPRLILKYGLPPAGGPTGRRLTVEGIEFVELRPGYFQTETSQEWTEPGLLEGVGVTLGLWSDEPYWEPRWTDGLFVEVGDSFWISKTELTRSQYYAASGRSTGSPPPPPDSLPIAAATCEAAQLKILEMDTALPFNIRLPTQDEWEYACRAGESPSSSPARDRKHLGSHAWFSGNTAATKHPLGGLVLNAMPVAIKDANAWGLHDTMGNLEEWCTALPAPSFKYVLCGGSCSDSELMCNPAWRREAPQVILNAMAGIRLVLFVETE